MLKLSLQYRRQKFDVYAIELDEGSCPTIDFLEQLRQNNPASHKTLVRLYTRHADHGQIMNERKSKSIKGYEKLLEFKSSQGDRLLYFYSRGRKTIITHGFHKKAPAKAEYERADRIRNRYLEEVENV